MEEELYMIGESPKVYEEMLGEPGEVALFLRLPDLTNSDEETFLTFAPQLYQGEECFLRIVGLPEEYRAWIH